MGLTNSDIVELTAFRRKLHAMPEVSGAEVETAREIVATLTPLRPDRIVTGLGGHGVAAVFETGRAGPTLMFRAELDALPIAELSDIPHRSRNAGKGHMCGHDGHMTSLVGFGRLLSRRRPASGRVILMFQPAEENGAGAAAVIADPKFAALAPDYAFAYHNRPGLPLGHIALDVGPANCASRGIKITLTGHTAHASMPHQGISPVPAMARLMSSLPALAHGDHRERTFRLVTITHAAAGEKAFGIAPGEGEVWATLRTQTDATMEALCADAEALIAATAQEFRLAHAIGYDDIFLHCENHPEAVAILRAAFDAEKLAHDKGDMPSRGSEDFGRFGHQAKSAMFQIGTGVDSARVHTPTYDFPDEIIATGARVFMRVVDQMLGT